MVGIICWAWGLSSAPQKIGLKWQKSGATGKIVSGRAKNSLDFGLFSPDFKQKVVFFQQKVAFHDKKWNFSGRKWSTQRTKMACAEDKPQKKLVGRTGTSIEKLKSQKPIEWQVMSDDTPGYYMNMLHDYYIATHVRQEGELFRLS